MIFTKSKNGFTLIELLVVMTLVGVIAVTATIINPVTQLQKARDSQRKSDLKLIQSVLEFHMSDNDYYPVALPACNNAAFTDPTGIRAKYLDKMPCDPKDTTTSYNYSPKAKDGTTNCDNITTMCAKYILYACLEYSSDLDRDQVNKNPPCSPPRSSKTYSSP